MSGRDIDAKAHRERTRQKRLREILVILGAVFAYLLRTLLNDNPIGLDIPGWPMGDPEIIIALGLIVTLGTVVFIPSSPPGDRPIRGCVRRTRTSDSRTWSALTRPDDPRFPLAVG